MVFTVADVGLSNEAIRAIDAAMYILWIVFLPLLIKFAVQIILGIVSTIIFGFKGFYKKFQHTQQGDSPSKDLPTGSSVSSEGEVGRVHEQEEEASSNDLPTVSVIVPAYNEEVGIVKTLTSVKNTQYPHLELIVVNDGSTDKTHEKIIDWIQKQKIPDEETAICEDPGMSIKYFKLENGGKAAAMNQAIQHATGEFVVTVDADSVMDPRAIREMMACFQDDPRVGAVAGNVIVGNRSRPIGMVQQLEYVSGFFFKRADSLCNAVYIIGGAAAAYRKAVLDEVGAFDAAIITEDIELSTRILKHHWKTRYAHNAYVLTEGPSDWMGLANQRLRWKFGRLKTFWKHRDLFASLRHNAYLSWFLLPLALYAEFLLFFDFVVFPLCFFYLLFVNMRIFFFVAVLLACLSYFQIAVDKKRRFHWNLVFVAPFTWLVALTIELVEFTALHRSIWRLAAGRGLKWQKWDRVGLSDDDLQEA